MLSTLEKKKYQVTFSSVELALLKSSLSFLLASIFTCDMKEPVPQGTSLPTMTFSLRPVKLSTFPETDASVKTLVVS